MKYTKDKLPKSWWFKNDNSHNFLTLIEALTELFNCTVVINWDYCYGYNNKTDKLDRTSDVNFANQFFAFNQYSCKELLDLITVKEEEFVLPEKWCVKNNLNTDEKITVGDWFNKNHQKKVNTVDYKECTAKYLVFPNNCGGHYEFDKPKKYSEITFEQFQKYVLKQEKTVKTTQTVTREQLESIWDVACLAWKEKIVVLTEQKLGLFSKSCELENSYIEEMYKAADVKQTAVLNTIFTNPVLDKNAFAKIFKVGYMINTSYDLFNAGNVFTIAYDSVKQIGRRDLEGRSFVVANSHDVILHKSSNGTVIEIQKK